MAPKATLRSLSSLRQHLDVPARLSERPCTSGARPARAADPYLASESIWPRSSPPCEVVYGGIEDARVGRGLLTIGCRSSAKWSALTGAGIRDCSSMTRVRTAIASEWVHLAMQAVDDTNVSLNAALVRTCPKETLCQLLEMVDRAGDPEARRPRDPDGEDSARCVSRNSCPPGRSCGSGSGRRWLPPTCGEEITGMLITAVVDQTHDHGCQWRRDNGPLGRRDRVPLTW